jgi:hypothetical protein
MKGANNCDRSLLSTIHAFLMMKRIGCHEGEFVIELMSFTSQGVLVDPGGDHCCHRSLYELETLQQSRTTSLLFT